MKKIYLAGGCFWGMQGYFKRVLGIVETTVGYANGIVEDTNYNLIKETDHAETLEIVYDTRLISLEEILLRFFKIIDPTSLNKQGGDIGRQYRTGIYYIDSSDLGIITKIYKYIENKIDQKLVVEIEELKNYILAEDYHQDYLDKNPSGYCHINLSSVKESIFNDKYSKPTEDEIKNKLSKLEFEISQNGDTEKPFTSIFEKFEDKGIYIDVVTGEPLFLSDDKFDAGCGWPSFTKPILTQTIAYYEDHKYGMHRTEVKSSYADSHLGHVFEDGPNGKLRYCINGAILRFVPFDKMDELGYGDYKILFK